MFIFFSTRWLRPSFWNGGSRRRYCRNQPAPASYGPIAPPPPPPPPLPLDEAERRVKTGVAWATGLHVPTALFLVVAIVLQFANMTADKKDTAGTGITCTVTAWLWKGCVACGDPAATTFVAKSCESIFALGWLGALGKVGWIAMAAAWVGAAGMAPFLVGANYLQYRHPEGATPKGLCMIANLNMVVAGLAGAAGIGYVVLTMAIVSAVDGSGWPFSWAAYPLAIGCGLSSLQLVTLTRIRRDALALQRSRDAGSDAGTEAASVPLVDRPAAAAAAPATPTARQHQQQSVPAQPTYHAQAVPVRAATDLPPPQHYAPPTTHAMPYAPAPHQQYVSAQHYTATAVPVQDYQGGYQSPRVAAVPLYYAAPHQ